MFFVPLTTSPDQSFLFRVPVDGKTLELRLRLRYNAQGGYWWMSVTDPGTGKMLVDSVPLITGDYPSANILEAYDYLGIGSAYVIPTNTLAEDGVPDAENLGTEYVLVWGDSTALLP